MHDRSLPVALISCLVALGVPIQLAHAQNTGPAGNPLDQLPSAQPTLRPQGEGSTRIAPPPVPEQLSPARTVIPLKFEIEGVKSIPFDDVAALFKPFAGQSIMVAKLSELARQVTAMYQKQGYALSFGFVPEQDFKNGVVRVIAVEGYVATVQIEGDAGAAEPKLREIAEKIRQERPLRLASFERYTQLMAVLPGLKVEARATPPAQTDGAGSMVLKVSHQRFAVSAGTDIRSNKPRAIITGAINDPIVSGSRLSVSTLIGALDGESFAAAGYSQVIGSEGLTLKAEVSLYRGNPDAQLDTPPAIRRFTTYERAELSASYPLKLTRSESLFLSGGFYATHNADDYSNPASGAQLTDTVNVRAVFAQASYNEVREDQAQSLTLRLAKGLNGAGASSAITSNVPGPLPTNPARLDFTKVLFEGSQRNVWGKKWGTVVSFTTQYTPDTLPSSERVSFGSTRFGRAYAAGEVAGDTGWGVGFELNRAFAVDMKYAKQLQPYVLLESAQVRSKLGTAAFSKLASASLGLRVTDNNYYSVDIALSKPMGDASPDNPDRKLRVSTQLSYNFEKR